MAKKIRPTPIAAPTGTALLDRFKDFPAIDIITRRFSNPNDPGSLPILLKDEDANCCVNSDHQNKLKPGATICHLCKQPARKWFVYWFNLAKEGRNSEMRARGYVPVEVTELQDRDDVSDLYRGGGDTHVRRGDRGQEILGKQPLELYHEIKRRQRAQRTQRSISKKHVRTELAEAAGRELGSEAGDMLHNGDIQVESMTRSRTTLAEEAGDNE